MTCARVTWRHPANSRSLRGWITLASLSAWLPGTKLSTITRCRRASSAKTMPSGRGKTMSTIMLGCRSFLHSHRLNQARSLADIILQLCDEGTTGIFAVFMCQETAMTSTHFWNTKVRSCGSRTDPTPMRILSPSKPCSTGHGVYDTARKASSPCELASLALTADQTDHTHGTAGKVLAVTFLSRSGSVPSVLLKTAPVSGSLNPPSCV